jgi:hypothetical protein
MGQHSAFHFSVTVHTVDLAVVYCLRAISDYSQDTGNSRITWGGTKDEDWRAAGQRITVRFSRPEYRDKFVSTASRLLPADSWREDGRSDRDPAAPQS